MQAREKSRPRECRGREVAGEAYEVMVSNCGDNGARLTLFGAAMLMLRGGSWMVSPRERKSGLLGVCGDDGGIAISSLVKLSRKLGEGASLVGADASEMERLLEGCLEGV